MYPCDPLGIMAHKEVSVLPVEPVASWPLESEVADSSLYPQRPSMVDPEEQSLSGQAHQPWRLDHNYAGCHSLGLGPHCLDLRAQET